MNLQLGKNQIIKADQFELTKTSSMLAKAQNGEIPIASLEKIELDSAEVSLLLARELMFWHSVAEGAKMNLLATLFYELHVSLLDFQKPKTQKRYS